MILERHESVHVRPWEPLTAWSGHDYCDRLGAAWHTEAYPVATHTAIVHLDLPGGISTVQRVNMCPDCADRVRDAADYRSRARFDVRLQRA